MMHHAIVWVIALSDPGVEQHRGDGQQHARDQVGAGDHLASADGVEQVPERQRADQVADGEGDQVDRRVAGGTS